MQLTDTDILEFQEMCRQHLGLELTWKEAQERAIKFVRLMQLIHRPMTLEEYERIKESDRDDANR
jgi:hypothetical protein